MITLKAPARNPDCFGEGYFGAPRGSRSHNGEDFSCAVGSTVLSPTTGIVSKLGYPYADDLLFRYVEVTTENDLRFRTFYVDPSVKIGDSVIKNYTKIGITQKLGDRYNGITEHVHIEVKNKLGEYIDPKGAISS